MSSSTHTPGAALVAEAADADPVTRLVLGWLAGKRAENTRTVHAPRLPAAAPPPARGARKLPAVSGWYAWLARRGHIAASPAAGIARPRLASAGPATPVLTRDQALRLLRAADAAPGAQRVRTS